MQTTAVVEELSKTRQMCNDFKLKVERLEAQKRKMKETIRKFGIQLKLIKRKQWVNYWLTFSNGGNFAIFFSLYPICFRSNHGNMKYIKCDF